MELTFYKNRIFLKFPFSWETVNRVKACQIFAWDNGKKFWYCPDNPVNRIVIAEKLPETGLEAPVPDISNIILDSRLMAHQKADVLTGLRERRWLFQNDTGTGKTFTSLELIKHINTKTLVVCPLSLIKNAWLEDAVKFGYDFKIVNLWECNKTNSTKQMSDIFNSFDVAIIDYELLLSLSKKFKLEKMGINCLILDESIRIKNHTALTTKAITKIADNTEYFFSLSATPAPNSIMEFFSQMRIINPALWGNAEYKWKQKNFCTTKYGGFGWECRSKQIEHQLLSGIAQHSSIVRKEDVLDLPERTFNIRDVFLSPAEKKIYKKMARDLVVQLNDETVTAANAAVKIGKLRQITAGFLIDSETKTVHDIGRSKLTELSDLLNEIGNNQVIIWTQYRYESVRIAELFDTLGKTYGVCNGAYSQARQEAAITGFKSGNLQYMVAHPASLGEGQTLVNCSYAVYFSRSYSFSEQYQSQDRIYRYGQSKPCTYFFLDVPGSVDCVIRDALKDKQKINDLFIDYTKNINKFM